MTMHSKKLAAALVAMLSTLSACGQPAGPTASPSALAPAQSDAKPGSSAAPAKPAPVRRVKFSLNLPGGFHTQQIAATINYARLEIRRAGSETTPIYAVNAENGFVSASGGSIVLAADVPDGTGWYAVVGLYINNGPGSEPVLEFKTAFDLPTATTIPIDIHTHLLGGVVEQLWARNSALVSGGVNLSDLQAYLDGLTGATQIGENWGFSRLSSLNPSDPRSLSPARIALKLDTTANLTLTQGAGAALTVSDYLPVPARIGGYNGLVKNGPTYADNHGFLFPVAIDTYTSSQHRVFFSDQDSNNLNEHLYGIDGLLISSGQSAQLFTPKAMTTSRAAFATGRTNPSGNQNVSSLFVLNHINGGSGFDPSAVLKAFEPATGNELWSFPLPGSPSYPVGVSTSASDPGLTLLRTNVCTCAGPQQDIVIVAYNAAETDALNNPLSGLYAVRLNETSHQPELAWFHPMPLGTNNNGVSTTQRTTALYSPVLASDHRKLYVMTNDKRLLILSLNSDGTLATDPETITQLPYFGNSSINTTTPMALGSFGAIYFGAGNSNGNSSRFYALNSDGTARWGANGYTPSYTSDDPFEITTPTRSISPPVIDNSGSGGVDTVYFVDRERRIWAINATPTPTLKWARPHFITSYTGLTPTTNLLLGAGPQNARILYVGLGSYGGAVAPDTPAQSYQTRLFAVKDAGSNGEALWDFNPGGGVWKGLGLYHGRLYISTSDGAYGQSIQIQSIRVESTGFPLHAPWPTYRGNASNAGISQTYMP